MARVFCDQYHCEYGGNIVCRQPESETVLSCDRETITTNKRTYTTQHVMRNFVCAECGGKLVEKWLMHNYVVKEVRPRCPFCDQLVTKIKHVSRVYWEDMQDIEQFKSLPDTLKDRVYPDWRNDPDFAPQTKHEGFDPNILWR